MSKLTHHDADTTLAAINATLRRADDLNWTDPGFLEWERGQVGGPDPLRNHRDGVDHTRHAPGPRHAHRYAWGCHVRPMIQIFDSDDEAGEVGSVMCVYADDYPDQVTMSGPLMLGPEPDTIPGPPPLPVPSVLFDATPDMSVFNALARRIRRPDDQYTFRISTRPHATDEGLAAFAMRRQSPGWEGWIGAFSVDPVVSETPRWVDPDHITGMAQVLQRCINDLRETAFGPLEQASEAIRSLGALMPDHPAEDTSPRTRALARRRSTQAWHTFTNRPERRRRGNH